MQEGLLHEIKGKIWPYDEFESCLYGYDNRYGVIVRRALNKTPNGLMSTEGAEEGLYEAAVIGIGLKASEILRISKANVGELTEELTAEEAARLAELPLAVQYGRRFSRSRSKFYSVTLEEAEAVRELVRSLPERPAAHVVRDPIMNRDFSIEEAAKLSRNQRMDPDDIIR